MGFNESGEMLLREKTVVQLTISREAERTNQSGKQLYQGSAFAVVDLPNSARMACNASLGGPMRRYCEYVVCS